MRTLRQFLVLSIFLLGAAAPALAQGGRAEINGIVSDAQKAVLPGVTVTVMNEEYACVVTWVVPLKISISPLY